MRKDSPEPAAPFQPFPTPAGDDRNTAEVETLFALTPDPLAAASLPEVRWQRVNPAFTRVLGWPEPELRALTFSDLVHPDDLDRFRQTLAELAEGKPLAAFENRMRCKSGAFRRIAWKIVRHGEAAMIYASGRDVTEDRLTEQALRESEARFRAMADGLPLLVWVHDAEGRQEFVNHTFCEFFGVTQEEMRQDRWRMLMHPDDADAYSSRFIACVRDRRPFHARTRVRSMGGLWRWLESWGRPRLSESGEYLGYVGASADITERVASEAALRESREALRESRDHLEENVRLRTSELKRTIEILREEIRQREQAESELQTLNAELDMRTAQLRRLAGELTMAEQRERNRLSGILHDGLQQYLVSARIQMEGVLKAVPNELLGKRAEGVLNALDQSLGISRSLSAELSPPGLGEGGLKAGFEWLASWMRETHDFSVELSCEKRIVLDEKVCILLFESVRELLFNVVKHASVRRAEVELRQTPDGIRITVTDEGAGFDPAAPASAPGRDGGLGLFGIRERLGLLGGSLEIDTAPGKGSRFFLHLPLPGTARSG